MGPYILPIIAENSGIAKFIDLTAGVSLREETDATGIAQRIVSDWRSAPKGNELKPEIIVADQNSGEPVKRENGNPERHAMSVEDGIVEDGDIVSAGDVIARMGRSKNKRYNRRIAKSSRAF